MNIVEFSPHSIEEWSLEELLERADMLGDVNIERSSWPRRPPFECEIRLADKYSGHHHLTFRGYGKDRRAAVVDAVREILRWTPREEMPNA